MDICDKAFEDQKYVITAFEGLSGNMISLKDVWREAWNAAILAEREACARICENAEQLKINTYSGWNSSSIYSACAQLIRERSNANVTGSASEGEE